MPVLPRSSPPDRRAARLVALAAAPWAPASEQPSGFSDCGVAALRAAVAECGQVDAGRHAPASPTLEAAVRDLVAEARAVGMVYGEQLLIALKRVWTALPEVQALPRGGAREAAWDRLVALCVQAFYAPVRPGPDCSRVLRLVSNPSDRAISS